MHGKSLLFVSLSAFLAFAQSATAQGLPSVYTLPGNPNPPGSKYEGIGLDRSTGHFYVSEVTGGAIHRGHVLFPHARPWLRGNGTDGRFTARGIAVARNGTVFIAGGPNAIGNRRPDMWVYSRSGRLLAALRSGVANAFLNDVWVAPDGAAYVTDSTNPFIYRVARTRRGWTIEKWLDATNVIRVVPGFNLGGIVSTPGGRHLLVSQGTTGQLWRITLANKAVREVNLGGKRITGADGIVLRGNTLWVIQNFPRKLTEIRLSRRWTQGRVTSTMDTDRNRVLTTGVLFGPRLLAVDSKFDENPAKPPYEVVSIRLR